jgi:DNA (cytosine-5)-methyltransferase 1
VNPGVPNLTYGSICTGYDGIGMGLRLAGLDLRPRWVAEIEPAMKRLLKREHPGVPDAGDVKLAPWHLAPRVRVMSSGDPCQTISIAGRQQGRKDDRFLWPWVRESYRAVLPDVLFFENVANITSHDGGRTLAERFAHLREDGYRVRWCVLGACAVGAPHHRHRWYAVAARVGAGAPEAERVGGMQQICGAPRSGGRVLLLSPAARDGDGRGEGGEQFWAARRKSRSNGMPLGAAVSLLPSPRTTDTNGPGRTESLQGGNDLRTAVSLLPTPKASDGPNGGPNQRDGAGNYYLPGIASDPTRWAQYAEAVALWEQIAGVPAPEPTEPNTTGGRRMSAALPEWMMGLPAGFLTGDASRAEAITAAGNGVVPLAVAAAWRLLTAKG